jgi:hypothetical protein
MLNQTLATLNEDEISMLWFIFNKLSPVITAVELPPQCFSSIKQSAFLEKVNAAATSVKPEHRPIYVSMCNKLEIPVKEVEVEVEVKVEEVKVEEVVNN